MTNTDTKADLIQEKYKSVNDIYVFLADSVVIIQGICFSMFMLIISVSYAIFLSIPLIALSLYLKTNIKKLQKSSITFWLHFNVLSLSLFSTYIFGFDSGFYYFIITIIFTGYFCTFENRFYNIALIIFEFSLIIFMYFFMQEGQHTARWLTNVSFVLCSLTSFFIIVRLVFFANFLRRASKSIFTSEYEELERISKHDPLTGLLNRRSLEEIIRKRTIIYKQPNTIVLLGDIDNFKNINDTYGHECGDKILKGVSKALRHTFRRSDIISRWGGEEFLIVIPNANIEFIHNLSDRLLKNVNQIKLPNGASVAITFGMCVYLNGIDDEFESVVEKADKLLYKGKRKGKDRVEMEIIK
ncbi:MAG: GGDEF domain-containing protein [Campylobacter sp.]|nr:GGDEF domain-containing protein [Campylobacter sp.]